MPAAMAWALARKNDCPYFAIRYAIPPKTITKLSQRKNAVGVNPPESSAAPSAASTGIAVRKMVESAVASSGSARRPGLLDTLIGPPRAEYHSDRRAPPRECSQQFRPPARRWI